MSNSNNPYSTEENNRNDQSNSRAMNDDSSKFLEEAPPNIAPPPAYEDVVKPQPILPSYDYHNNYPQNNQSNQSYHPPPIPPPTGNYNQTSTRPANSNKNRGPPRCCCCCVPSRSRNKSCGCGWIIVFFAFIILTTISVANNNACNKIPIEENPHQFSFDSSKTLYINVDNARLKRGEVRIFQGQTQDFSVEVYTGSKGTTPQFGTSNRNGNNELIISQTSGFSIFNVPPRCMKARIDVYLPNTLISNTIKVRDLNVLVSNTQKFLQGITLITEDGSMLLNYTNAQNISLFTRDGTILLNNAVVDRISIKTEDGDVGGSLTLNNELSISTFDGDVDLFAKIAQNANNANINVNTNDGDVGLSFGNSFSGIYDILSRDGRIRTINADNNRGNHVVGNFNNGGNGGNSLNITTDDGNVLVLF